MRAAIALAPARPSVGERVTSSSADRRPKHGWSFRSDIEGLRALAILLVVRYHTGWKWMSGGFLGVDVFFVLSGYLMTGILLDEVAQTGTISLMNFWARRARRLLPAATFILLVVLAVNTCSCRHSSRSAMRIRRARSRCTPRTCSSPC